MKKIIYIAATTLLFSKALTAQQLPLFSQYVENNFVLNPAVSGTKDYSPLRAVVRNQWSGIEGSPNTQTLSFHHGFADKKMGFGVHLFNDQIGPVSQTGLSAAYSYHIKITDGSSLSFGIAGLFYNYKLNTNKLKFDDQSNTDNVLVTGNFQAFYPNFSAGVYYYTKKFFTGISVPELMQTRMSNAQDYYIIKQVRHYYFNAGYTFDLNDNYTLQPSVLVKYVQAAPVQVDINAVFEAYKKVSIGVSYRSGDAIVAMLGFKLKDKFVIGYSYDITMSHLNNYSKGSHEIMLGYNFFTQSAPSSKPSLQ